MLAAATALPMLGAGAMILTPRAAIAQSDWNVLPLTPGQTLTGRIEGSEPVFPGTEFPHRAFALQLQAGQTMTVSVASQDIIVLPLVMGPNNFMVFSENDSPQSITFTAPASDVYFVVVMASERRPGSFTVSARAPAGQSAPAARPPSPPPPAARPNQTASATQSSGQRPSSPPAARPAPPPPPAPASAPPRPVQGQTVMTITGGWTARDRRLDRGSYIDSYSIMLQPGQRVVAEVDGGSVQHALIVIGPDDFTRAANFNSRTRVEFTAPADGSYSIGLSPQASNATGSYRATITIHDN